MSPTFLHGKEAQVYITDSGGTERELSSYGVSVTFSRDIDTAEASTFGDDDKVYVVGLKDATFTLEGRLDATVDGYLNGLAGGTPRAYKIAPMGSVAGRLYYSGSCILTSYELTSELGDVVGFSAEFQNTGAPTRGTF